MIPMSCPNCGRRGSVPPDRLNTRMHCKKCDAVFYMDPSGKIVLGDPDAPKTRMAKPAAGAPGAPGAPKVKKRKDSDPPDLNPLRLVSGLPKPVQIGLVVTAMVVGLWASGIPRTLGKAIFGETLSKDILERAVYVGDAYGEGKADGSLPRAFNRVTAEGTQADLETWFKESRPEFKFVGPQGMGNELSYVSPPPKEEGNESTVIIRILPPPNPESDALMKEMKKKAKEDRNYRPKPEEVLGYNVDGSFDLPTKWSRTGPDDDWMLNGTKTLEYYREQKAKFADAGKPAPAKKK